MYYVFGRQFLTFPNGESANAHLHMGPKHIEPIHWWSAQHLTVEGVSRFNVYPHVPLFDNYPNDVTGVQLYSARLIELLAQAGITFQAFPATLIDIRQGTPLSHDYAIFHLLEAHNAIDIENSSPTSLRLTSTFLQNPRPFFRPVEAKTKIFIHETLRAALERAGIMGCLYEPIEKLGVAVPLRRRNAHGQRTTK